MRYLRRFLKYLALTGLFLLSMLCVSTLCAAIDKAAYDLEAKAIIPALMEASAEDSVISATDPRSSVFENHSRSSTVWAAETPLAEAVDSPQEVLHERTPVDILIVAAHPDDEHLFMGAVLPIYAGQRQKRVLVSYMAYDEPVRVQEAMAGIIAAGGREMPVFGGFTDKKPASVHKMEELWNDDDVIRYLVGIIRKYKPAVIVTHDFNGEYGHPAHKLTARLTVEAAKKAADPSFDEKSLEEYGAHSIQKLYIHLYKENAITLDVTSPLSAFGGKSAVEVARRAYRYHVSQQKGKHFVSDSTPYSIAEYGLYYSSVGPDVIGGDLLENVTLSAD